jgi:hypothetical protein
VSGRVTHRQVGQDGLGGLPPPVGLHRYAGTPGDVVVRQQGTCKQKQTTTLYSRCTVVGNPGGSLGFWPNSFDVGPWSCQNI